MWFANLAHHGRNAPFRAKAAIAVLALDALLLVAAKQSPGSAIEWLAVAAIVALSIAAMLPLERRPALLVLVVVVNIAALLIVVHDLQAVTQRGVNGLSLGAIYALGAVGLTLVYGILKLVNFAHGDFLTFGAYMAYLANVTWGLPLIYGVALAVVATIVLALFLERTVWAPMRRRGAGMLQLLLMAIGLAFVLRYSIQFIWDTKLRRLDVNVTDSVEFLGLRIGTTALIVVVVSAVALVATGLMLRRTVLGKRMRALADDPDLAEASGIDTARVILWTWVLAAGLAALAGVCAAAVTQVKPELGFEILLPIFAAVVLGGIGNAFGALSAGVLIGVLVEWSGFFVAPGLKLALAFVILVLVLIIRPEGLLGKARAL